jgi:hypothetical protein
MKAGEKFDASCQVFVVDDHPIADAADGDCSAERMQVLASFVCRKHA